LRWAKKYQSRKEDTMTTWHFNYLEKEGEVVGVSVGGNAKEGKGIRKGAGGRKNLGYSTLQKKGRGPKYRSGEGGREDVESRTGVMPERTG